MKYHYFVSYSYGSWGAFGFGNCEVIRSEPLLTIQQMSELAADIASTHDKDSIVILNFTLLRVEEEG